MSDNITVQPLSDVGALEALAPEWWDLWRRSPSATPFQAPAWLLPWWRHFSPGGLASVAVRRGKRLAGLALFYREEGPHGARLLPLGMSLSDHLDVLLDPDDAAAASVIVSALAESSCWARWELEELAPDAAAWALPCPPGCVESQAAQSACPVLAWEAASEDPLPRQVPAEQRRNLRRAWRRATARGPCRILCLESDPDRFLDALLLLHGARWQSRGEAGVLADDAVQRFHRSALPGLAAAGLARLYVLTIADQLAGAYYGLADRQRAYAYLGGFEPAFARESPGVLLLGKAISEAAREGLREFDFLRGREAYKYSWGAADRDNQRRSFQKARAA